MYVFLVILWAAIISTEIISRFVFVTETQVENEFLYTVLFDLSAHKKITFHLSVTSTVKPCTGLDSRHMKVLSLSSLRTGQDIFVVLISVRDWVDLWDIHYINETFQWHHRESNPWPVCSIVLKQLRHCRSGIFGTHNLPLLPFMKCEVCTWSVAYYQLLCEHSGVDFMRHS
jgi:hypothetical protein